MNKIEVMSDDLANKIAAGEVVERCMNVVKELVENSIDAKALNIKIELIDSGVKEIKITDDGVGMSKDDAILCFKSHATSKLKTINDLFNIASLGFRGEALASIASVSKVTLKTSDGITGTIVNIEGGKDINVLPSDIRKGTCITVKNLFYNTPVRLKYLKSLYTELSHITDYVNKMALSYPNIKFNLINNGTTLLNTDGSGNLLKVINAIYGLSITKKMIEVNNKSDDYQIIGYISYPEVSKSNRSNITILVNNRVIKNNDIVKTILESYHTYIPNDRYPVIVLNIIVDPYLIDVNIHPTKMDVKFSKIEELNDLISKTILKKLKEVLLIPEISINIDYVLENIENKSIEPSYYNPKKEELSFNFEVNEKNELLMTNSIGNNVEKKKVLIKPIKAIGVIHKTYIIGENDLGMYIIDQHAAAERVNYEKVLKSITNHDNNKIDLLFPITIELPSNEYIILKENFKYLDSLGFIYEEFSHNTIIIRSHPTWLPKENLDEYIRKIIDIIVSKESFDEKKFRDRISATIACKMSVRAHDYLTLDEMQLIINNLIKADNPYTCPHGRPTIITYSAYDLEKLFKRVM